ncbi:MAG: RNA polymerase sigma factor [Chitinophagaceae bacterium]|nr:RNA polymerase sigma factor [Chitinophagaceae bacterium]
MVKRYDSEIVQDLLSAEELTYHVEACALNKRESQKVIYNSFYGYAMAVCDRYTNNQEDAVEILNDGFLKIFREIHHYRPAYSDVVSSFKGWLRKIMVYTAIDHFRKNQKHKVLTDLDHVVYQVEAVNEDAIDKLSHEEIIRAIQELSPGYRTVLNLFIIDGLSHEEISKHLGISTGTSKSNLSKARRQLQKILFRNQQPEETKNAI